MYTKEFWKDAAERAIKTFLQAVLAVLMVDGTTLLNADWQAGLVMAGTAAAISLITSLVSGTTASDNKGPVTASVVSSVTYK